MRRKISLKFLAGFSGRMTAKVPRRNPSPIKITARKKRKIVFSLRSHTVSTVVVITINYYALPDESVDPTAVIGAVTAELQMKPIPSFQYGEFERKLQMTTKVKKPVKLLDNVINNNTLNPGINGAMLNRQFLKITVCAMMRAFFVEVTLTHIPCPPHSHPIKIV